MVGGKTSIMGGEKWAENQREMRARLFLRIDPPLPFRRWQLGQMPLRVALSSTVRDECRGESARGG